MEDITLKILKIDLPVLALLTHDLTDDCVIYIAESLTLMPYKYANVSEYFIDSNDITLDRRASKRRNFEFETFLCAVNYCESAIYETELLTSAILSLMSDYPNWLYVSICSFPDVSAILLETARLLSPSENHFIARLFIEENLTEAYIDTLHFPKVTSLANPNLICAYLGNYPNIMDTRPQMLGLFLAKILNVGDSWYRAAKSAGLLENIKAAAEDTTLYGGDEFLRVLFENLDPRRGGVILDILGNISPLPLVVYLCGGLEMWITKYSPDGLPDIVIYENSGLSPSMFGCNIFESIKNHGNRPYVLEFLKLYSKETIYSCLEIYGFAATNPHSVYCEFYKDLLGDSEGITIVDDGDLWEATIFFLENRDTIVLECPKTMLPYYISYMVSEHADYITKNLNIWLATISIWFNENIEEVKNIYTEKTNFKS